MKVPQQESEVSSWGNGPHPSFRVQAGQPGSQNAERVSSQQQLLNCYTVRADMTQTSFFGFCGDPEHSSIDGGPIKPMLPLSGAPNPVCDFL